MKIHTLTIKNYRSYAGEQKIEFSINNEKNVTIIMGINGAGKTNIINAINWCLYNDEPHLSKIDEKKPLWNQSVEHELKTGTTAECKVMIVLGNDKPLYRITRTLSLKKEDNKLRSYNQHFNVEIIKERGWIDAPDPTYAVNNVILPKKIREYFLFDGERLDEFFRSGNEDLIRSAVLDVAQIGLMEKAEKHLSSVLHHLNEEVARFAPNTKDILERIVTYNKSKDQMTSERNEKETQKRKALNELDDIRKILREYPVALIRELQKNEDELDEDIRRINDELDNIKSENRERILTIAPFIFTKEAISRSLKKINTEFDEGRLPPLEEEVFVKSLLKKDQCICGTKFIDHPECREVLNKILKDIPAHQKEIDKKITDEAYELKYILESLNKSIGGFFDSSISYDKKLKRLNSDLEIKNKKRREVREKIGKQNIEELEKLQENQEQLEEALREITLEIRDMDRKIVNTEELIKTEESNFRKESKKEDKVRDINLKAVFCKNSLDILGQIKTDLIDEIRKTIENKTKEYFFTLIWKKKAYSDVKINKSYKISVIDKYGVSCLGSLSAGERQVLALSFMAALYEVSGFDMPAVIDTPLGRISGTPRENIAKCLPEYLRKSQLTLLILDTEYTQIVQDIISTRVDKEYLLDFNDEKSETAVKPYAN